jgi:hypothetical protein
MPLVTIDEKVISTNDASLHTRLKIKAAQMGTSLGKLVDTLLRRGFQLGLEEEENFQKAKEALTEQ